MLNVEVDTDDLMKWARYMTMIQPKTGKAISNALNVVGEAAARNAVAFIADETGLDPEDVASLILVKEATPDDLTWVMDASQVSGVDSSRPWAQRDDSNSPFAQSTLVKIVTSGDAAVCFPSFVLVSTPLGDRTIQSIRIGDEVFTRAGIKKVAQVHKRRYDGRFFLISTGAASERIAVSPPFLPMHDAESSRIMRSSAAINRTYLQYFYDCIRVAMSRCTIVMQCAQALCFMRPAAVINRATARLSRDGKSVSLPCTSNHPIWCERSGFLSADAIQPGDRLQFVDNKPVDVTRVVDLGFADTDNCPTGFFQRIVFTMISFLRMPITTINLQRNFVDGKVSNVCANLHFLDKGYAQSFKGFSYGSFNSSLSAEFAVARPGAKASTFACESWHCSECDSAINALHKMGWSSAFFRAIDSIETAFNVVGFMNKRLTTARTWFFNMFHTGAFALHGAKIITVGDCAPDREFIFAPDAGFCYRIGAALTRAKQRATGIGCYLERRCTPLASKVKRHWCSFLSSWLLRFRLRAGIKPAVYNISVEDQHEFYANSLLVHNCQKCLDAAANSPYTLQEVNEMNPYGSLDPSGMRSEIVHPLCRCMIQSWQATRQLPARVSSFGGSGPPELYSMRQLGQAIAAELEVVIKATLPT